MADFVDTPMDDFAGMGESCYGKDGKGSPGIYDKTPGDAWAEYARTSSPNAVHEKFYEEAMPGVQPPAPGNDGEQANRSLQTVHENGSKAPKSPMPSGY